MIYTGAMDIHVAASCSHFAERTTWRRIGAYVNLIAIDDSGMYSKGVLN